MNGYVGKVGGWGSPNGASQYPAHLHFEVHKNINNKYIPVDPYGWIGGRPDIGLPDPYASLDHYGMLASSIPRDINSNLWQNSTPPGQPPIARFTMQSGSVQKRENEVLNLTVPPGSTAPVDFSAVLSFDPDGTIPTYKDAYRWYVNGNLQDGEPNEPCAGRSFSKNFPAGTWQILLIVQDNQGTIGAVGASIVVTDGSVPTASTVAATNVTANSATLNGTVNPNGLSTTVYFQWGTTTAYGNTTPSQSIGSGTSNVGVSANLSGLSPSTTYHYRVVATNNAGTTYGADVAFTTAPITSGCTVTPISIGQTMNGALSMSDCPSPVRGSSYYADRYSFSASAGQQVAILLTSSAFDTYLYLIGPNNSVIAQDDEGGGGNNSRIPPGSGFYSLPSSGTYIIEVTSYAANATGTYTLSLSTNSNIVIFQDNMESGSGSWSAQSPWGLTTSAAYSPTHSWTDSPAGNYSNNANVSLWSPFLNFSGLSSVTLTFQHRYDLESGYDFGRVWVTTDNGTTFTQIASFTGTNTAWAQTTIDLSAFAGRPSVRIVFQLLSDASITRDGWYIDDVLVTGR